MNEIYESIEQDIKKHPIILFMKGSKSIPMCGFSGKVVEILNDLRVEYEVRNVLENTALRAGIKEYSGWPTLPQLYVHGEFIGGCDIVTELYEKGKLKPLLKGI